MIKIKINETRDCAQYTIVKLTDYDTVSRATDEIRDLSRASREMLNKYDDIQVEAVDFTATRTPAEWNTLGRESIMRNYDMMRPHTQLLFFDYFTVRCGEKFSK